MDYPWYSEIINDSTIQQGDFVNECPIIIPPESITMNQETQVDVELIDSIVLSQSCDLINNKVDIVLVCPFYPLKTFVESLPEERRNSKKSKEKLINNLRQGHLPGYHLLNSDNQFMDDYQVVDFRNVYGIKIAALQKIVNALDARIRLLPPYREHLSQSFARYFMRVGLPQDITVEGYF